MLKNYVISALNNLRKFKLFSVINILGLAIGLAVAILITLYFQNEISYDKHWNNADRLYRMVEREVDQELPYDGRVSMLAASALKKYFSFEISATARVNSTLFNEFKVKDVTYSEAIHFTDRSLLELFEFEGLAGDLENVFRDTSRIALSEEVSTRLFGEENPLGQIISVSFFSSSGKDYQVEAVYKLAPGNTTFSFPAIALLDDTEQLVQADWGSGAVSTYILLNETVDVEIFSEELNDFVDQAIVVHPWYTPVGNQVLSDLVKYELQAIPDLYFSEPVYPDNVNGNQTFVYIFALISILILLIACTNYVILATAKSGQRAREVALRKVAGANFKQLLWQFLGESLLITLIALSLSLSLVELTLPLVQNLPGMHVGINYSLPGTFVILVTLLLTVCVVGGIYPALVIAKFRPAETLKANQASVSQGSSRLRHCLIIFQFSISIGLIIATGIIYAQLSFTDNLNPGYQPQNLIQIGIGRPETGPYVQTLKQEVKQLPQVVNATLTGLDPGESNGLVISLWYAHPGEALEQSAIIPTITTGLEFFETFQISLIAGRYFKEGLDPVEEAEIFNRTDLEPSILEDGNIIINMAAVRELGFQSPEEAIGQEIHSTMIQRDERVPLIIVGVVENSQYRSLRELAQAEVYRLVPGISFFLTLRYQGDPQSIQNDLEKIWHSVLGDEIFEFSFVEDTLALSFQEERNQGYLLVGFSSLAIFIACLGLFGVASFTVDRRVKEIGIRKVMGADTIDVMKLLLWQFTKPLLIANLLAWPVVLWIMIQWLQRFPYQINYFLFLPICIVAGLLALAITWITVGSTVARASNTMPVLALRYE